MDEKKDTALKADEEQKENGKAQSLSAIIREQVREEDTPISPKNISLRKVIGGEILYATFVRKQIWVMMLITVFVIIHIAQGYSYKKYVLEIDKLTTQLKDAKYRALSTQSELTERTRESSILDMLKSHNDTTLVVSSFPPYIIEVPEK